MGHASQTHLYYERDNQSYTRSNMGPLILILKLHCTKKSILIRGVAMMSFTKSAILEDPLAYYEHSVLHAMLLFTLPRGTIVFGA